MLGQLSRATPLHRGDVGRGLGRVVMPVPRAPPPSTPNQWQEDRIQRTNSNAGTPLPEDSEDTYRPYQSQDSYVSNGNEGGTHNRSPHSHHSNGMSHDGGTNGISNHDGEIRDGGEADVYIWGTTIKTQEAANSFRRFLDNFTIGDEFEPFYLRQLEIIHR